MATPDIQTFDKNSPSLWCHMDDHEYSVFAIFRRYPNIKTTRNVANCLSALRLEKAKRRLTTNLDEV